MVVINAPTKANIDVSPNPIIPLLSPSMIPIVAPKAAPEDTPCDDLPERRCPGISGRHGAGEKRYGRPGGRPRQKAANNRTELKERGTAMKILRKSFGARNPIRKSRITLNLW